MTEVNNAHTDPKNRKDIRKRLVKLADIIAKIDQFIGFMQKSDTDVEASDDIMIEVQKTLADLERESLLSYCNEQVLFLMKNLMNESLKIDDCHDENVKKAFDEVKKGYDEVKQAFDAYELMNRQQICANGKDDLQKCYDRGKNLVEKLQMLATLVENYFDMEDHSVCNQIPSQKLLRKDFETIRMRETIKNMREKLVIKFKRQKRIAKKREEKHIAELKEELLSQRTAISKLDEKCKDQQATINKLECDAEVQEQKLNVQMKKQLDEIQQLTATLDEERLMAANKEERNTKDNKALISKLEKEKHALNKSLESAEERHLKMQMELTRTQDEVQDIRKQNIILVAFKKDYNEMLQENEKLHDDIAKNQANFNEKLLEFQHKEDELKKQLILWESKYQSQCDKLEVELTKRAHETNEDDNVEVQPKVLEFENTALKLKICEMHKLKKSQLGLTFGLQKKVNLLRRRMSNKMNKYQQLKIAYNNKIEQMKNELSMAMKCNDKLSLQMQITRTEFENKANKMLKNVESGIKNVHHEQVVLNMEIMAVQGRISKASEKLDEEKKLWSDAEAEDVKYNSRELNMQILQLQLENKKKDTENFDLMETEERLKTRLNTLHTDFDKLKFDYDLQLAANKDLKMTLKSLQTQSTTLMAENKTRSVVGVIDRNKYSELEATSRLQAEHSQRMLKMLTDMEDRLNYAKGCIDLVAPNVDMINENWMKELLDIIYIMRGIGSECNNCNTTHFEQKFNELESKLKELQQKTKQTTAKHKKFFAEWQKCYEELCAQSNQYRQDLSETRDMIERMCNKYKAMQLSSISGQDQNKTTHDPSDLKRLVACLVDDPKAAADKRGTVETVRTDLHQSSSPTLTTVSSIASLIPIHTNSLGKTFGDHRRELLNWCRKRVATYGLKINDFGHSWSNGMAFCALIHSYRPDLLTYQNLKLDDSATNLKLAEFAASQLGLKSDFNIVATCLKPKHPKYMNVMKCIEKLIECLETQK